MTGDSPAGGPVFVKPKAFELRMAVLFGAQFMPNAIAAPYLPLWMAEKGLTASQIAMVVAAPNFVRILAAPAISAYADRSRDRVNVLMACAILSAGLAAVYFVTSTYAQILVLSLLLQVVWAPHTPLVDSLALSGVRRFGSSYTLMRGVGSVAFLMVNVIGGYALAWHGAQVVPGLVVAGLLLFIAATIAAPRLGPPRRRAPLPGEAAPQAASLLKNTHFLLFVASGAMIMSSHAFFYAFGAIWWRSLGIGEDTIGWFWAVSVICEVIMFGVAGRLFQGRAPEKLLMIAGAVAILRWSAMPFAPPLGVPGFFVLQSLHAFTFSLAFVATQSYMAGKSRKNGWAAPRRS